jgi:hypothetical protein
MISNGRVSLFFVKQLLKGQKSPMFRIASTYKRRSWGILGCKWGQVFIADGVVNEADSL